jgi:hypothetical protein
MRPRNSSRRHCSVCLFVFAMDRDALEPIRPRGGENEIEPFAGFTVRWLPAHGADDDLVVDRLVGDLGSELGYLLTCLKGVAFASLLRAALGLSPLARRGDTFALRLGLQ